MKPITFILAMSALLTMVTSCRTPRPVAHHSDTLRVESHHYDSIDRWHYITEYQQGDTVYRDRLHYIDRYHIRWRDSIRTVHDSIPYAVEVVKTKTDYTGWWCFGGLAAVGLFIVVFRLLRLFRVF